MNWRPTTVVAASGSAISLAGLKQHLRVETTDEDDLITRAGSAAADFVQNHTNRRLLTQQIDLRASRWPYGLQPLELPTGPVQSVDEIAYRATSATSETVLASTGYELLPEAPFMPTLVVPNPEDGWPALDFSHPYPVRVRVTAGYGAEVDIPTPLQQAMLLLVGHWYENRQEVVTGTIASRVQLAAEQLIRDYVLR